MKYTCDKHIQTCGMCGICASCGAEVTHELSLQRYGLCPKCLQAKLEESSQTYSCWMCGQMLSYWSNSDDICIRCAMLVPSYLFREDGKPEATQ